MYTYKVDCRKQEVTVTKSDGTLMGYFCIPLPMEDGEYTWISKNTQCVELEVVAPDCFRLYREAQKAYVERRNREYQEGYYHRP